jgi:hypothetical protein
MLGDLTCELANDQVGPAEVCAYGCKLAWLHAAGYVDRCAVQLSQNLAEVMAVSARQRRDEHWEILADQSQISHKRRHTRANLGESPQEWWGFG